MRKGIRREGWIVLVVVLKGEGVLAAGVPVEVGYGLDGGEAGRAGQVDVVRLEIARDVSGSVRDEVLSGLAGRGRRIEQGERDRIDVGAGDRYGIEVGVGGQTIGK